MILWISIFVAVICFVIFIMSSNKYDGAWDAINLISLVLVITAFVLSMGLGGVSIIARAGADAYLASMQEKRSALVYQLENNIYDNDNDLGKKELYSEITEYNCDVAKGKTMRDNIWFYNLYADVYDNLELIEFPEQIKED